MKNTQNISQECIISDRENFLLKIKVYFKGKMASLKRMSLKKGKWTVSQKGATRFSSAKG